MDRIKEFAEKGVIIAVAFDKDGYYYKPSSWYFRVGVANDTEISYGYNNFEETLEEAYAMGDWYLETMNYNN